MTGKEGGSMAFVVLIVAIVMGTVTCVTLTSIWLGTSYSLKKHGYHPNQAKEICNQLKSDLRRISADLEGMRGYVADLIIMNHDRATKIP